MTPSIYKAERRMVQHCLQNYDEDEAAISGTSCARRKT